MPIADHGRLAADSVGRPHSFQIGRIDMSGLLRSSLAEGQADLSFAAGSMFNRNHAILASTVGS
jgi:hypothetical protein